MPIGTRASLRRRPRFVRSAIGLLTFAVAGLLGAAPVQADAVKVGGFWIRHVHVRTISDGQVVYITANGARVQQGLARLEGLRLEHDPGLGKAVDAIAGHKDADAAKLLAGVADKASRKWVRHYARWLRVGALTRAKQPVEALRDYLTLLKADAGDAYLSPAPMDAIEQLTAEQRQQVLAAARAADHSVSDSVKPYLQKLLSAVEGAKPAVAAPARAGSGAADGTAGQPTAQTAAPTTPAGTPAATPTEGASASEASGGDTPRLATGGATSGGATSGVVLPQHMRDDRITPLLRAGQFQQALDAVTAQLKQGGNLGQGLYEKGMAELGLAQKSDSREGYLDAGLDFMRVAVYFPHSMYAGPSLVEAGYVHAKIDRPDIARQLYQEASGKVNSYTEPAYAKRLEKLTAALKK